MKKFSIFSSIIFLFSCNIIEPGKVYGCTDSMACNYNSEANSENNSCIYFLDCDGICGGENYPEFCSNCDGFINDIDNDGICDELDEFPYDPNNDLDYSECNNECINNLANVESQPFVYIEPGISEFVGNSNSNIIIEEFFSFQCPYCSDERTLIEDIRNYYNDDIKIVFKNATLQQFQNDDQAALYCLAAGKQGAFYELYQLILENFQELHNPNYPLELAYLLGLDTTQINIDIQNLQLIEQLEWEKTQFQLLEYLAVPTFLINGYKLQDRSLNGVINFVDCLNNCIIN